MKDDEPKTGIEMKDEWEVDSNHVIFLDELGEGAFGKVYKAVLKLPQGEDEERVRAKLKSIFVKSSRKNMNEVIVAAKALHGE